MERMYVSSRANETVKRISSFSDKSKRDKEGVFVAEGATILFEALEKKIYPEIIAVRKGADIQNAEKAEKLISDKACTFMICEESAFEKMTTEKASDGFISVFKRDAVNKNISFEREPYFIALERVQDPGNVGTVLRSALALGAGAVFTIDCADPFSQKAVRSSMGAVFSIPIINFGNIEELYSYLCENKIRSVAAALHTEAKDIRKIDFSGKTCIIIGNEGKGLSEAAIENADERSIIPISGAESLNAAAAASIFLWEMRRRR